MGAALMSQIGLYQADSAQLSHSVIKVLPGENHDAQALPQTSV